MSGEIGGGGVGAATLWADVSVAKRRWGGRGRGRGSGRRVVRGPGWSGAEVEGQVVLGHRSYDGRVGVQLQHRRVALPCGREGRHKRWRGRRRSAVVG